MIRLIPNYLIMALTIKTLVVNHKLCDNPVHIDILYFHFTEKPHNLDDEDDIFGREFYTNSSIGSSSSNTLVKLAISYCHGTLPSLQK